MDVAETDVLEAHYNLLTSLIDEMNCKIDENDINETIKTNKSRKIQAMLNDGLNLSQEIRERTLGKVDTILMRFLTSFQAIDYAFKWVNNAINTISKIFENNSKFSITNNSLFVEKVCFLFNGVNKVCIFIGQIKGLRKLVKLLPFSMLPKTIHFLYPPQELSKFVISCIENPVEYLSTRFASFIWELNSIVFQSIDFYDELFNDDYCFKWEFLSIYESEPLLNEKLYYLSNTKIMSETILFYLLIFFPKDNSRLKKLFEIFLPEKRYISLTKTFFVPVKSILNHLIEKNNNVTWINSFMAQLDSLFQEKQKSHLNRIKKLCYLLEDYVNCLNIDKSLFLCYFHHIKALMGLSIYEIDCFFSSLMCDDKEKKDLTIMDYSFFSKVIYHTHEISTFFNDEKDYIKYFFFYNLAVTDSEDLEEIINLIDFSSNNELNLNNELKNICKELKEIDIQCLENGVKYDLFPLMITIERILSKLNYHLNGYNYEYCYQLVKQLISIYWHCEIAQDPHEFFYHICEIDKLWKYSEQIEKIIYERKVDLNDSFSFLIIYNDFNYDKFGLCSSQQDICYQSKKLSKLIDSISIWVNEFLNDLVTNEASPINIFANLIEFDFKINDPLNFEHLSNMIQKINDINQFSYKICHDEIHFLNRTVNYNNILKEKIILNSVDFVLKNVSHNLQIVCNSYQFLWPIFINLDSDLNLTMFDKIFKESIFVSPDIQMQAKAFTSDEISHCPPQMTDEKRVVFKISNEIINFIENKYDSYLYISFIQQFKNSIESSYSKQYFIELFRVFGIYPALYFNCVISKFILHNIFLILKSFRNISPIKILKDGINIVSNELNNASDSLLQISIGLTIRNIIRQATKMIIDESIPGFSLFYNAIDKSDNGPSSFILDEVLSSNQNFYFIKEYLKNTQKSIVEIKSYYIFLGLLFGNSKWEKMYFYPDEDAISKNLHLLPYGYELMMEIVPLLFEKSSEEKMQEGIIEFFQTIYSIYKKKCTGKNSSYDSCFTILVDKFPHLISFISYNHIESFFPYYLLSSSYPNTKTQINHKKKRSYN